MIDIQKIYIEDLSDDFNEIRTEDDLENSREIYLGPDGTRYSGPKRNKFIDFDAMFKDFLDLIVYRSRDE